MRCVLKRRTLAFRRFTAVLVPATERQNSVQAALHTMKCDSVTVACVTVLKRSTSRLGRSTERVDARTARERK
jgi:hypothetical protein